MTGFFRGHRWPFVAFYMSVALCGYMALALWFGSLESSDWIRYLTFILLTIIADLVNLNLPRGGAMISVSTPVTFASAILLGPGPAAWIEVVSALVVEGFVNRRAPMKIFFNVPVLALSVGLAGMAFRALPFGGAAPDFSQPLFLLPLVVLGLVHFMTNTGLVSVIIGLSDGMNPYRVWKSNYAWNIRHLVAFVPITAIIILVYHLAPWTLALFIIPILLVKYAYQLYLDMREVHISTLSTLASALDAKDPYTQGHSYRVSRYAILVGEEMNLGDGEMQMLEYSALLHDIGKIGIAGDIISKPGKLSEAEMNMVRQHPVIGARIIQRLRFLGEAADVIKFHHERPDGLGYPDGLTGGKIPMLSRILHVCDTFDAMTSNRPYRPALSPDESVAELRLFRGRQFDSRVVDAFIRLYESGKLTLIHDEEPVEIYEILNKA